MEEEEECRGPGAGVCVDSTEQHGWQMLTSRPCLAWTGGVELWLAVGGIHGAARVPSNIQR